MGTVDYLDGLLINYVSEFSAPMRLVELPPTVVVQALRRIDATQDADLATPLSPGQPDPQWLVAGAIALRGRLLAAYSFGRGYLQVDGIQVPVTAAGDLLAAVAAWPSALEVAMGGAWPSWGVAQPSWRGPAEALRDHLPEAPEGMVALWWD